MSFTLNTVSGQVGEISDIVLNDPNLNQYLKVVPEGTKPLVEGMFTPGTVEEFNAANNGYPDHETPEEEIPAEPVNTEEVPS